MPPSVIVSSLVLVDVGRRRRLVRQHDVHRETATGGLAGRGDPPIASTKPCDTARPSPTPVPRSSRRWKPSNIASCSSVGTPGPWSITQMRVVPARQSWSTRSSMGPGAYLGGVQQQVLQDTFEQRTVGQDRRTVRRHRRSSGRCPAARRARLVRRRSAGSTALMSTARAPASRRLASSRFVMMRSRRSPSSTMVEMKSRRASSGHSMSSCCERGGCGLDGGQWCAQIVGHCPQECRAELVDVGERTGLGLGGREIAAAHGRGQLVGEGPHDEVVIGVADRWGVHQTTVRRADSTCSLAALEQRSSAGTCCRQEHTAFGDTDGFELERAAQFVEQHAHCVVGSSERRRRRGERLGLGLRPLQPLRCAGRADRRPRRRSRRRRGRR